MLPIRRKIKRFKTQTISIKQPQIITELEKKYFGEDNNSIDYFMEIGVEPIIFKDENIYDIDSEEELSKRLSPKIITKFPNFDKRNIVIEQSMINQIFPKGFNIIKSDKNNLNLNTNINNISNKKSIKNADKRKSKRWR